MQGEEMLDGPCKVVHLNSFIPFFWDMVRGASCYVCGGWGFGLVGGLHAADARHK